MHCVSVSPELTIVIRRDVPGQQVNIHGQVEQISLQPALYAQFRPKALDYAQRVRADLQFKQLGQHPYGAVPFAEGGVMGSQFGDMIADDMPETYAGYNPVHQLGSFNTAIDIDASGQPESPAELRKLVEERLRSDSSLNRPQGFIILDDVVLEKPWPNYPLEGQGRHAKIGAIVKEMGIDPRVVIAFESAQDKPGDGVIKTMEAVLAEQAAEQAESDALSVTVPR